MSWLSTLIIFTCLLLINAQIIEYIIPLPEIVELVKMIDNSKKTTVFGVAIFALLNVSFSVGVAMVKFGLRDSIILSVSSALIAAIIKGSDLYIKSEIAESH
jgi:hypothetical protein